MGFSKVSFSILLGLAFQSGIRKLVGYDAVSVYLISDKNKVVMLPTKAIVLIPQTL
jgi:hypothetical protein